jgi:hypothetical protein
MEPDGNSSVALTPAWHSIGARAFPAPAWHYGKTRRRGFQTRTGSTTLNAAPWWWWKARPSQPLSREPSPCSGLGIFCGALFALATHALPFFVGMTMGIYSFQVGAGPFGAIVVGFVAGSTTLVAGQFAYSVMRSPIVRLVVGLLFALPAACAGYDVTLAFAHIGVPSEWWREAFAVVGAITVGGTAWARMSIVRKPTPRSGVAPVPPQPPMGAAATSR